MKTAFEKDEKGERAVLILSLWDMWRFCLRHIGLKGMVVYYSPVIVIVLCPLISAFVVVHFFSKLFAPLMFFVMFFTVFLAFLAHQFKIKYFRRKGMEIRR